MEKTNLKNWLVVSVFLLGLSGSVWATGTYEDGDGSEGDPFQINTPAQMDEIGQHPEDWGLHFILTADIDLGGFTGTEFNIIGRDPEDPFQSQIRFTGVFDGNGKRIFNFTYSCTGNYMETSVIGIFGIVGRYLAEEGEIENLGLINPSVVSDTGYYVASLAGNVVNGKLSNCYVKGGSVRGHEDVGGLVGGFSDDDGTITNCYTTCNVIGERAGVGGITGFVTGIMSNCYASGNVTGEFLVGGLVGGNHNTITNCYATGIVQGLLTETGGLVGKNWGAINNSYSTGMVIGGGFGIGGLVGDDVEGTVTASFWDKETSGQTTSAGGTGKTTAEMKSQSTFVQAGWDFVEQVTHNPNEVWTMCRWATYPKLTWQVSPAGSIYYVDGSNGNDNNDGLSLETAFGTIHKALDTAWHGNTIIVVLIQ